MIFYTLKSQMHAKKGNWEELTCLQQNKEYGYHSAHFAPNLILNHFYLSTIFNLQNYNLGVCYQKLGVVELRTKQIGSI